MGTCFIAMPITTSAEAEAFYGDGQHWQHVMECLFVPAIERAGYVPILPVSHGTEVIHDRIFQHLCDADLVLGDFSSHNANVFYELGIRTALNLPVALVLDEHTTRPFDLGTINSYVYDSSLRHWDMEEQVAALSAHLGVSTKSCDGQNPLWRRFSLGRRAASLDTSATPSDARFLLLEDEVRSLSMRLERTVFDRAPSPPQRRRTRSPMIRVDLSRFGESDLFVKISPTTTVQAFLNEVYFAIQDQVQPSRYLEQWCLRTRAGRLLEKQELQDLRSVGTAWGIDFEDDLVAEPVGNGPDGPVGPDELR